MNEPHLDELFAFLDSLLKAPEKEQEALLNRLPLILSKIQNTFQNIPPEKEKALIDAIQKQSESLLKSHSKGSTSPLIDLEKGQAILEEVTSNLTQQLEAKAKPLQEKLDSLLDTLKDLNAKELNNSLLIGEKCNEILTLFEEILTKGDPLEREIAIASLRERGGPLTKEIDRLLEEESGESEENRLGDTVAEETDPLSTVQNSVLSDSLKTKARFIKRALREKKHKNTGKTSLRRSKRSDWTRS